MLARPAIPKNSPPALHPANTHSSTTLPLLSFQSLTTIKFSNPLVLITIRNAGGCVYTARFSMQTFKCGWRLARPGRAIPCASPGRSLSPLESAPTRHSQLIENTATLSPLQSTLKRPCAVTPLECALTKKRGERAALGSAISPEWRHALCAFFVFNHLRTAQSASSLF